MTAKNLGDINAVQCGATTAPNASSTVARSTANDIENSNDNPVTTPEPPPLYQSPRLKGYITLLSSSVYNYISAENQSLTLQDHAVDWCLVQYDLNKLTDDPRQNVTRLRYAMSAAMITNLITGAVILIHFVSITGLGNKLWSKFNGKVELYTSTFLTLLWIVTTWFNTTIRGPAGYGKEQYNLYFSTWICCFTSFWTLESWSTSTGRASFERFVRSWPNRCPMWIVTFILAFTDFCFVLDASRNWKDGVAGYPYIYKYFSRVKNAEWVLLVFVTALTFSCSIGWVLVEIFRENKINSTNLKSDQETHVEGFVIHILTAIWVPTVFVVTVPGGAASLLGNMYFTTWGCAFSVVGTLVWWQRNWREGIFEMIEEQQNEYDTAKRAIRSREEKRLAALQEETAAKGTEHELDEEQWANQHHEMTEEDTEYNMDDDDSELIRPLERETDFAVSVVGEDDCSIQNNDNRPRLDSDSSSVTTITCPSGVRRTSKSLYVSALSELPPSLAKT